MVDPKSERAQATPDIEADAAGSSPSAAASVKLYAEELAVTREAVDVSRVKVAKHTLSREQLIDEALLRQSVQVQTVPIGRRVESIPPTRQEGDTTILSIVEEVLVVERHLMLKEEVHIRRVQSTEQHRETVTLRYQQAEVERTNLEGPDGAHAAKGLVKSADDKEV